VPLEILWSDENYVAVAKPPGLAVIPGRAEDDCLLLRLAGQLRLRWSGDADPRLRLVHRIDKETSGVVVFATNRPAQQHLSHQFQNNRVHKEYLAIVVGAPPEDSGVVDAPIGHHPQDALRMMVTPHGRPARTEWRVEQRFIGYTLLRVMPKTGKTHQIRVHLRHIGLPLAVDPLYGAQSDASAGLYLSSFKRGYRPAGEGERPLIARLTLHAEKLGFAEMCGRNVEICAPWPKDFRAAVNMLAKYAANRR